MGILHPSSFVFPVQREQAELKTTVRSIEPSQEIFIDEGLPIPDAYDVDLVRVLVQDPFCIYIYWELRQATLNGLRTIFSTDDFAGFKIVLRLIELRGNHEAFFEVGAKGDYWMGVYPDRRYQVEIGARSPKHGYVKFIGSNIVETPRGTVSVEVAEDSRYRVDQAEFIDVLEASGFGPEETLAVGIVGEDEQAAADYEKALETIPQELHHAILTAAAGRELTDEDIDALPDPIKEALLAIRAAGGDGLTSAALLHYLPEIMRWLMLQQAGAAADFKQHIHITPRFLVGSSEIGIMPVSIVEWLPSLMMRHRPGSRLK